MENKKKFKLAIGMMLLLIIIGGVSFAFFNYIRTGSKNIIKVGRISFNTNQAQTINLTNIFPIDRNEVETSSEGTDTAIITITGDTTYEGGIEYLVTAEEVNVTVNNKKIPISLYVSNTTDLGDNDPDYFENRGGEESIYKPLANSIIVPGQYILVGYIAPGAEGIDGEISIKGFIDKSKILISDTYPEEDIYHTEGAEPNQTEVFDYTNGTPDSMAEGKVVLTTTEWNSLQQGNGISFKIRVEANEGVWVPEETNPNAINIINYPRNSGATEIHFIKETPLRMQRRYEEASGTKADLTYNNEGKVLAWQEGDILYIASSGETYFTTGYGLFGGFNNIEKIVFENVNSSRVTNMSGMFSGCTVLEEVNIKDLDTQNVTNMSGMFYNCASLTSIDLSNMGSDNLTNAGGMFSSCNNLETINMSGFDFGPSYIPGLFSGLTKLKTVNLSNADTSGVTNMREMFKNCSSLTSIDLSNLGSDNLIDTSSMFSGCTNLASINMSGFDFGTTSLSGQFAGLTKLTNINLSNADTSGVTNMSGMLSGCSSLTSVDLSNLGSNNLTNINSMFYGCNNLESINMSGFDFGTASLSGQFTGLAKLTNVNLSNADTSGVTNMSGMFYNCASLTSIDLSNLGSDNLTTISNMFYGCNNLASINMSGFDFGTASMNKLFSGLYKLEKLNISNIDASEVDDISNLLNSDTILKEVNMSNATFGTVSMGGLFSGLTKLETVNLSNADTSYVTSMSGLFSGCSSLKSINLSGLGGNNLTTVASMFYNCINLTEINMSGFDFGTAKINELFSGLSNLETINLSNADTSGVTEMARLFYNCSNLTTIDLSGLGGDNLSIIADIFYGCTSLKEIDMSGFNFGTASLTFGTGNDCRSAFADSNVIEKIDLSNADMSGIKSMYRAFYNFDKLKEIDFTNVTTESVTNMSNMFTGCISLESVDLSGMGSENLTNVIYMFSNTPKLETIIMSNFVFGDTMNYLFADTSGLKSFDLTNADTSNVVYMQYTFHSSAIDNIDLTNLSVPKLQYMDTAFGSCQNLKTLNLRGFGSNVLNSIYDFVHYSNALETVNMENFNFGTLTHFSQTDGFRNHLNLKSVNLKNAKMGSVTIFYELFYNCPKLEIVDISGIDTSNVVNTNYMFSGCPKLKTIYASNTIDFSNITTSISMFSGCQSLVGGNGTTYDGSHADDVEYARIDAPGTPGYFTLRNS